PEGKQRPEDQIAPVNHSLCLSSLPCRKVREAVDLSEMVLDRPLGVMVQGLGQVSHFSRTDELGMGFCVVHPASAPTKESKLVIGVATGSWDPLTVVVIPSRLIISVRAGRICVI